MKLLCLGDSNTYGYDPRSYLGGRYPADSRWPDLLAGLTGWEVLNEGENGREIPHTPAQLREMELRFSSAGEWDVMEIMLGSNDMLQLPRATAEQVTDRMERFLTWLLHQGQRAETTVLTAPPALLPGPWISGEHQLLQSARLGVCYQDLARRLGVNFADAGTWEIGMTFDGLHFSPEGHQTFAVRLAEVLDTQFPGSTPN